MSKSSSMTIQNTKTRERKIHALSLSCLRPQACTRTRSWRRSVNCFGRSTWLVQVTVTCSCSSNQPMSKMHQNHQTELEREAFLSFLLRSIYHLWLTNEGGQFLPHHISCGCIAPLDIAPMCLRISQCKFRVFRVQFIARKPLWSLTLMWVDQRNCRCLRSVSSPIVLLSDPRAQLG